MNQTRKLNFHINSPQNCQQVTNHIKSHLLTLKILHSSNSSLHSIKQSIWQFNPKLPIEYQRSILEYCSIDSNSNNLLAVDVHMGIGVWIQAARMFKGLDCKSNLDKRIKEFEEFIENKNKISKQQESILKYNLAGMCEMFGYNQKASNLLKFKQKQNNKSNNQNQPKHKQNYSKIQQISTNLQAILYIKSQLQNCVNRNLQKNRDYKKIQNQSLIRRFRILNELPFNPKTLSKFSKLMLFQLYNLGLVLKKTQKYQQALKLFFFVLLQLPHHTKTSILCKINIAQCQFKIGLRRQAIMTLINLDNQDNSFINSYKMEIKSKIEAWQQTSQILNKAMAYGIKYKQQVLNCLVNTKKQPHQNNRNLLTNRKLLFLQQKQNQFEKLKSISKHQKVDQEIKISHKSYRSLVPNIENLYMNKTKIPKYSTLKKNSLMKNQNQNLSHSLQCQNLDLLIAPPNTAFISKIQSVKSIMRIRKPKQQKISSQMQTHSSIPSISSAYTNMVSITNIKINQKEEDQNIAQIISTLWILIKNSQDQNEVAQKYLSLGDAYIKQGDLQNAIAAYKNAIDKNKHQAYNRIANLYYNNYKFDLAIQNFQKYFLYTNKPNKQQKLKLYHCYTKIPHHMHQASQNLKKHLQENPNDTQAHILLVTVLMKQKNFNNAILLCEKFKITHYLCNQNHHIMGLLYKLIGNKKKAFQAFLAALRIQPCNVGSLIQATQLAQIQQFLPQLVEIYRKSLISNNKSHELLQILHQLLTKKKIHFQTIKSTLNFSQLIGIGDFFMQKQMINEAQIAYNQAGQYTNNTLLKQKLGNLQYMKNNFAKAQKYYKQSQKRRPMFSLQIKLCDTLIKQNKFKQAQQIISECVTKQNQNKSICYNMLGQCMFGLGNYQKALQNFQFSTKLNQNKKINLTWENACRKKIMEKMKDQSLANLSK